MKRRVFVLGAVAAAAATLIGSGVIGYVVRTEWKQADQNRALANYDPPSGNRSRTLVVYFSRSGNTELMALEIAKDQQADVIRLGADAYRLGLMGWINAMKDARGQDAAIAPSTVDLSEYDRVFIGSPIWLYSPAPPIMEFVSSNDFTAKDVILFNTFNSKFEDTYIDRFKESVTAQGGHFENHIWVRRGRMTDQIDAEELIAQVRHRLSSL
ncbi:MAG: flavodoxin [Alphaproteobacteria bacterium]